MFEALAAYSDTIRLIALLPSIVIIGSILHYHYTLALGGWLRKVGKSMRRRSRMFGKTKTPDIAGQSLFRVVSYGIQMINSRYLVLQPVFRRSSTDLIQVCENSVRLKNRRLN
jgi:hypothetical protein